MAAESFCFFDCCKHQTYRQKSPVPLDLPCSHRNFPHTSCILRDPASFPILPIGQRFSLSPLQSPQNENVQHSWRRTSVRSLRWSARGPEDRMNDQAETAMEDIVPAARLRQVVVVVPVRMSLVQRSSHNAVIGNFEKSFTRHSRAAEPMMGVRTGSSAFQGFRAPQAPQYGGAGGSALPFMAQGDLRALLAQDLQTMKKRQGLWE